MAEIIHSESCEYLSYYYLQSRLWEGQSNWWYWEIEGIFANHLWFQHMCPGHIKSLLRAESEYHLFPNQNKPKGYDDERSTQRTSPATVPVLWFTEEEFCFTWLMPPHCAVACSSISKGHTSILISYTPVFKQGLGCPYYIPSKIKKPITCHRPPWCSWKGTSRSVTLHATLSSAAVVL